MRYIGSKRRIAKYILPIILQDRKNGQTYIEPFCGGCNSLAFVANPRIGIDVNPFLIAMWKRLQEGWKPPQVVTEQLYKAIKKDKPNFPAELVGFVGFSCSFGGKWFGGYARGATAKGVPRNYAAESYRHLQKQVPKLQGVRFFTGNYFDFSFPQKSIIYCDPPYANAQGYGYTWDSLTFWNWCDKMAERGHQVYVSEYQAPSGWTKVWSKSVFNTLDKNTGGKTGNEALFTLKG